MALVFNGTTQRGQLAAESIVNNSAAYSWAVFFKPDAGVITERVVFGGFNGGGLDRFSGSVYRADQVNKPTSKQKTSATVNYNAGSTVEGGWNIHTQVRSATGAAAGSARTRLNATAANTTNQEENSSADLAIFGIAAKRTSAGTYTGFFPGAIYGFYWWNRALSNAEQDSIHTGTDPKTITSGLVDYFEFSGSGSPATITSAGGTRTLTLTNSPTLNTDNPFTSIGVVNGGNAVAAGATVTASVTGFTTVNAGTIGTTVPKALTGVSYLAGTVTFTSPIFVDAQTYPEPDTNQTLTLTDGISPATKSIPTASPNGYTSVVLSSPDNIDQNKIGYHLAQAGFTPVNTDRISYKTSEVTVGADTSGSAPNAVVTRIWHWVQATSTIYAYDVTINEAGVVTSVTGISRAGISDAGITRSGLSSAGLR